MLNPFNLEGQKTSLSCDMILSGELEQTYLGSLFFKSKHRDFSPHPSGGFRCDQVNLFSWALGSSCRVFSCVGLHAAGERLCPASGGLGTLVLSQADSSTLREDSLTMPLLETQALMYWVTWHLLGLDQPASCLLFITCYRKTRMNFLANPVTTVLFLLGLQYGKVAEGRA